MGGSGVGRALSVSEGCYRSGTMKTDVHSSSPITGSVGWNRRALVIVVAGRGGERQRLWFCGISAHRRPSGERWRTFHPWSIAGRELARLRSPPRQQRWFSACSLDTYFQSRRRLRGLFGRARGSTEVVLGCWEQDNPGRLDTVERDGPIIQAVYPKPRSVEPGFGRRGGWLPGRAPSPIAWRRPDDQFAPIRVSCSQRRPAPGLARGVGLPREGVLRQWQLSPVRKWFIGTEPGRARFRRVDTGRICLQQLRSSFRRWNSPTLGEG